MAKVQKIEGKKGVTYRIDYIDPTGKRIRRMFKKKKDADAELAKRVSLMAEGRYLDVKKDCTTTLDQLLAKYEENFKHQSHYKHTKWYYFRDFKEWIGGGEIVLDRIKYVDLETYKNHLINKLTKKGGRVRKASSINREMAGIHHLFEKAVEWEMIEKSPFDGKRKLNLKENHESYRHLEEDEIPKLMKACECKPYLHRIVVVAINTGLDKCDLINLKWENIQGGHIYTSRGKTKAPLRIPINDEVDAVLKDIRKEQGLKYRYVFVKNGKRIKNLDSAFRAAVKRSGIQNFHFKGLRHTFGALLAKRKRSMREIQLLMGHANVKTTMRYAHLGEDQKKDAVDSLGSLTGYLGNMSDLCPISETASASD